jgi:hypothetical protein
MDAKYIAATLGSFTKIYARSWLFEILLVHKATFRLADYRLVVWTKDALTFLSNEVTPIYLSLRIISKSLTSVVVSLGKVWEIFRFTSR